MNARVIGWLVTLGSSLVIDPPDGRIPPHTPQNRARARQVPRGASLAGTGPFDSIEDGPYVVFPVALMQSVFRSPARRAQTSPRANALAPRRRPKDALHSGSSNSDSRIEGRDTLGKIRRQNPAWTSRSLGRPFSRAAGRSRLPEMVYLLARSCFSA